MAHNILSKNDRALVAYLISQGAGTAANTFPAKRSAGKSLPCTVVWSEECIHEGAGSYTVRASVMVRSSAIDEVGEDAETARLAAETRLGAIGDALMTGVSDESSATDELATLITTAARAKATADPTNHGDLAAYTCLACRKLGDEAAFEESTDTWVDTINLEMAVVAADVS